MNPDRLLVLYDGHCLLCNRFIRRALESDKNDVLRAAPLQTFELVKHTYDIDKSVDSVILIMKEGVKYKSDAVLSIKSNISSPSWLFRLLMLIPRSIRDFIYDFIARNRLKWFGKSDECVIPNPALHEKYLMETTDLASFLERMHVGENK